VYEWYYVISAQERRKPEKESKWYSTESQTKYMRDQKHTNYYDSQYWI
jgi:hypothetical protein